MSIQEQYDVAADAIQSHYDAIHTLIIDSEQLPGGTCYYYHDSTEVYRDLIPKRANLFYYGKSASRIADIGFNAGHSTLLFALANPSASVTVFDLFDQAYAQPCLDYVREAVTNTIDVISGNTLDTLGPFSESNKESFDLVNVSGSFLHEVFKSDFEAALKMVKVGGVLIIDNTIIYYISFILDEAISQGLVEELNDRLPINTYNHRILRRL